MEFQPSHEVESKKEKQLRMKRNRSNISYKEKQLNINVSSLPNPPPLSDNKQYNKAMDTIRSFELEQMSYSFKCCASCKERRLNLQVTKENICRRCNSDKNIVKMFSNENYMDPGEVPAELIGLSVVEQQLICRIAPAIHVHLLKHGGIASSGHCVTFPQDVNEPAQILPKLPHEINVLKVRRQGKNDSAKEFRVRRYTIQSALQWLKSNNPAYSDIIISEERLNKLPVNDGLDFNNINVNPYETSQDEGPAPEQLNSDEVSGESDSCVLLPEPSINIRDEVEKVVEEVVGPEHGSVTYNHKVLTIPWPTRDGVPVSEFTTRNFFTLAYPCLFPTGLGDFYMNRPRTCSAMADWADHLIWYSDGRFANHPYFKFIVHNMIMRKRTLGQSTYIFQQQLGDKHLTVSDIKEKLQKGDRSIAEKIVYFGACLRGTDQYWVQRSRELRALIQFQINEGQGLPSFFTTGSCAEYHFKPLRRLLEMYSLETTGIEVDLGDRNVLFATLQRNTHVVAHYFDMRTTSYFNKVMGPLFGVKSFWYRQEFAKSRGMIHWHGLCWRGDREPHNLLFEAIRNGLKDEACAEVLATWAKLELGLTALHPAGKNEDGSSRKDLWPPPEGTAPLPPDDQNPLLKLLIDISETQESIAEDHFLMTNRINLHRCSNYCLRHPRAKGSDKTKICRMEFGSVERPGKPLRCEPAIVKDKKNCDRLELERDHPMLVQHSQFHTQGWRANGDISLILSRSGPDNPSVVEIMATEKYVSGYACKGNESTGSLVDLFNDMANAADEAAGATSKSLCTKLLMNTVKRDVSAVEASFELSRIPLYRCSHQFQRVTLTGSRVLERTGSTLTRNTPLDKYLERPTEDTSSWYEFICKSGKVPVVTGGSVRATWPLSEGYSRTMLILHSKKWRTLNQIKSENETWNDRMLQNLECDICPNFLKADVQKAIRKANDGNFENEASDSDSYDSDSDVEQPDWMELIAPTDAYDDVPDEFKYDDGGPDYDWSLTTLPYPYGLGLNWLEEISSSMEENDLPLKLPDVTISTLNKDQKFAYNLVMNTLFSYIEDPNNFPHLRMVVAGTAGSGKSYLIKCLVHSIRKLFNRNKAVQVLCPTGTSANLIYCVTYHSFLKIPTSASEGNRELSNPNGSVGDNLQKNCTGIVALLVDERSLIGSTNLGWMEFRSRFEMNNGLKSSESWGGLPVVVFLGDDVQLPPVCDFPVYKCESKSPAAMHGCLVWQDFNTVVTLTTMVRQNETQAMLRNVLLGIREYKTTKEQALWLQQFQWDNLRTLHGTSLLQRMASDGLFVFPTHTQEWNHNKAKLLEMNEKYPIAKIQAEGTGSHSKSASSDKAGGLTKILYICKGAKVMLTSNINVPYGLFNGSMGTVVDIIYCDGRSPSDSLPDVIMVNFPKYTGPALIHSRPNIVPIVPVECRIGCSCKSCKRKQHPLRLSWGGTLHRCQGTQVGKGESSRYIVINPGPRHFESRNQGALFVALSRAKSAGTSDPDFSWHPNLILNEDRICHVPNTPTTRARKREIARLDRLTVETKTFIVSCTRMIHSCILQIN